ncbi:DPOE4 polymerase, partial [Atractosteus spatula]|nr:DPOE4 polymerase [Atractosteus spatula]
MAAAVAAVAVSAAPAESEPDRSGAEEEAREGVPEEDGGGQPAGNGSAAAQTRLAKLPLSRIKALMKADPDVTLASQESVFIIAKATELFVEMIARDALVYAQQGKRKTLQRKDLDNAIEAIDEFAFLEAKGVQMQKDIQCCMQYSGGKVRAKDVVRLYTKRAVKCADPRDRKVKRLLMKLTQRQRTKAQRSMWPQPQGYLPLITEVRRHQALFAHFFIPE